MTSFSNIRNIGRAKSKEDLALQGQAQVEDYEREEHTKWGIFLQLLEAEQQREVGQEGLRQRGTATLGSLEVAQPPAVEQVGLREVSTAGTGSIKTDNATGNTGTEN